MKPFLLVCLLVGGLLGLTGSCGPQKAFCPNRTDNECVFEVDSGSLGGAGGGAPLLCDGGTTCPCPSGGGSCCLVNNVCVAP